MQRMSEVLFGRGITIPDYVFDIQGGHVVAGGVRYFRVFRKNLHSFMAYDRCLSVCKQGHIHILNGDFVE